MITDRIGTLALIAALATLAATTSGCATVREVQDRIDQEVDERVDEGVDDAVEGGADKVDEGVRGAISGEDGPPQESGAAGMQAGGSPGETSRPAGSDGNAASPSAGVADGTSIGSDAWANYDFVPGDRVLFFDDFEADVPGNFARGLRFGEGNASVVEFDGGLYLRTRGGVEFDVVLPEALPERFTLEFDVHMPEGGDVSVVPETPERSLTYYERGWIMVDGGDEAGIRDPRGGGGSAMTSIGRVLDEGFETVRVMADGPYVKAYVGENRVANVPNATLARSGTIRFEVRAGGDRPVFFDDIRVAAGGSRITYDALMRNGRLVTRAILFETGSATLKGESTTALADIARVLERHPDLTLVIEGHTDSQGAEEANRSLSQRRAAAVRSALVDRYGVAAGRLTAVGRGEADPVASNDTAEGRQSNRRVELVVDDGG